MSEYDGVNESDRLRYAAEGIEEAFCKYRDRRLISIRINKNGKKKEARYGCKRKTLRLMRDAISMLHLASVYDDCIEEWLDGDLAEDQIEKRLKEGLSEVKGKRILLRREKIADEVPEEGVYRECVDGIWYAEKDGRPKECDELIKYNYHVKKGRVGRRVCANCLSYEYERCHRRLFQAEVSPNGVCLCWTDPMLSLCLSCVHGGEFDGRRTHCKLHGGECYSRMCKDYLRKDMKGKMRLKVRPDVSIQTRNDDNAQD